MRIERNKELKKVLLLTSLSAYKVFGMHIFHLLLILGLLQFS